jgi:hypothetical protein
VQGANIAAPDAACLINITLHITQRTTSPLQQGLARRGEAYGAGGSGEEWVSKQILKLAYLLRQRRLGNVETLGRTAKVQLFRNRNEVAQLTQLNIAIHIQNILILPNKILDVLNECGQTDFKGDKNA